MIGQLSIGKYSTVRSVHSRMNNVNSSQRLKLKFCVSLVDNVTVDTSDECYRPSHKAQKDEEYKDVDSKHRDLIEGKSTMSSLSLVLS